MSFPGQDGRANSKQRFWQLIGLLLPVLAAALFPVMCLILSPKKTAWVDEVYALWILRDPSFRHMFGAIRSGVDGGMPLYYVLGWLWGALFGHSLLVFRCFSAVALGAATLLLWKVLLRHYSASATAIGLSAAVLNSWIVMVQSAEIRFYGLYALAAVCVFAAYARLDRNRWGLSDGLLLFFANTFLLYSHVFGIVYSIAALAGFVIWDKQQARLRLALYAFVAASWLTLLPLLPTLRHIGDLGKPHNWMTPPLFREVIEVYGFVSVSFSFSILAVFALLLCSNLPRRPSTPSLLLYVALSFMLIPIVAAIKSHFGTVVAVDRYYVPTIFATGVLLTAILDSFGLSVRAMAAKLLVPWACLLAFLISYPIVYSYQMPDEVLAYRYDRLEELLAQQIPPDFPVVVEDANTFLPLTLYRRPHGPQYYYPLDWDAALASASLHATVQSKLLRNWKNAGYLSGNVLSSQEIRCRFDAFVVLRSPEMAWFEQRIQDDPNYSARPAMDLPAVPHPGPNVAWVVQRVTPRNCGDSLAPSH